MPINEKITIDESEALRSLINLEHGYDAVIKKAEQAGKTFKKSSDTYQGATTQMSKASKMVEDHLDSLKRKEDEAKKSNDQLKTSLKGAADQTTLFGVNIGGAVDQLNNKIKALRGVQAGLKGTTTGLKLFKVALVSTGVGALIVTLGSLVAYFTRTQKGIDAAKVALAALGSVIDNVVDRIAQFGGGLVEIFKGNPSEGFDKIKNSLTGLGEEIRKDALAAADLEKRSQALRDATRDLNREQEKTNALIEEKRFNAKNLDLTEQERIKNLKEAQQLESDLEKRRLELANENLAIIRERNSLAESFVEDLDAEADAEAELDRIRAQSSRNRRRYFAEEQAINQQVQSKLKKEREDAKKRLEEERKEAERLAKAYTDILDEVNDRIADAELEKLSGVDRLRAEKDIALAEIDILENRAKAAAEAAGIAYEAEKQFYELRQQIQKDFENQVNEGRGDSSIFPKLDPAGIKAEGEKIGIKVGEGISEKIQESLSQSSNDPFAGIREKLKEVFKIDDQQLDNAIGAIETAYSTIRDNITQNLDLQLDANSKLLDSIRSQTESVEEELERQQELKDQGFANDVSLNQKKLVQLQKQEKEALAEQRKIQKQRNAIDTAEQIGSLITASANIYKSFSPLGPFGVALAIAAIGTMFGTFAATKIRASRAARAFKGGPLGNYLNGDRSGGFIAPGGASDIPGRGDGYRIEGTNMRVGGDEFIVSEGPAREHGKFLKKLNKGAYRGFRFDKLFIPDHRATVVQFEDRESKIQEAVQRRQENLQRTAIENGIIKAVRENTQQIVGALDRQKHVTYLNERIRSVVSEGGSVIEIIEKVG